MEQAFKRPFIWDCRFLKLAQFWAQKCSKDPSTKVGAVIVNDDRVVVGMGYNGFPRGVDDSDERLDVRETKYKFVVHAEANAILNASAPVKACTLYTWPLFTCNECAKLVIQAGIVRVVSPLPDVARWQSSYDIANEMYREAGIVAEFVDPHTMEIALAA